MLFPKSVYTVTAAVADGAGSRSFLFRAMANGDLPFKYQGKTRVVTGEDLRKIHASLEDGDPDHPKMDKVAENLGHGGAV